MESRPEFEKITDGHEAEVFRHVRLIFDTPETVAEFVSAEQTVEHLRDSFAGYFQRYEVLLCPVTPFPATKHGPDDLVIDGQTVSPFHVMTATAPFSLTGLPALSMRFGTDQEGLPIGVQNCLLLVDGFDSACYRLEAVSPFRDRHPVL
jgi:aspartyl-tRNA(Asn)/glutamyl-tRNA(Gln) amidotransferase subunit A